mmetsp:Transcript_109137/g.319436  ORF Transcript_109137/g.319436 Transcript_109137/m.319436 type:complete len:286 (+) Transcript_109137:1061-1918(+)
MLLLRRRPLLRASQDHAAGSRDSSAACFPCLLPATSPWWRAALGTASRCCDDGTAAAALHGVGSSQVGAEGPEVCSSSGCVAQQSPLLWRGSAEATLSGECCTATASSGQGLVCMDGSWRTSAAMDCVKASGAAAEAPKSEAALEERRLRAREPVRPWAPGGRSSPSVGRRQRGLAPSAPSGSACRTLPLSLRTCAGEGSSHEAEDSTASALTVEATALVRSVPQAPGDQPTLLRPSKGTPNGLPGFSSRLWTEDTGKRSSTCLPSRLPLGLLASSVKGNEPCQE